MGPVKRATITYGPNGVSRGVATIIFSKADSANAALNQLNGVLVDKRPMKVEDSLALWSNSERLTESQG